MVHPRDSYRNLRVSLPDGTEGIVVTDAEEGSGLTGRQEFGWHSFDHGSQ